jgi:hypothetical protein
MVINSSDNKTDYNLTKFKDWIVKDLPFEGYLDPVNFIENKRKHYMKNNIFNEIERMKQKESHNNINYLKIMRVSQSDYEKSQIHANNELEKLTQNHVNEILSTKKLLHIERNILEILNYLIGNFYFHWETFKEKINFYELKHKMEHIDYDKLDPDVINKFLNKISSKKEFESDYLRENFISGFILFNWIKCIMKIFLFKYQNKLLAYQVNLQGNFQLNQALTVNNKIIKNNLSHSIHNNNNSIQTLITNGPNSTNIGMTSNSIKNLKHSEVALSNMKIEVKNKINLKKEYESNSQTISDSNKIFDPRTFSIFSGDNHKNLNETNCLSQTNGTGYQIKTKLFQKEKENFYLTNIKYQTKDLLKPIKIGTESNKSINKGIKNQQLKIEYNLVQENKKKFAQKMQDIPLLYVRTYGQLRKYFHNRKVESSDVRDKHFKDIRNMSLRDSNNSELFLKFVSKGKITALDNEVIENFIEKK